MGPIAIAVATLIALMVLLKLSKRQANQVSQPRHSDEVAVPPQAAQLFASLDLSLGEAAKKVADSRSEFLPSAETLRVKLNLVRAYITIEDFKAARQALHEILLVSTQVDPDLTIQAQSLLAELDQRSA